MEEALNYQADRMIWPSGISQFQALATVVLAQWTQERSSHGQRDGLWAPKNSLGSQEQPGLPLTKAEFSTVANERPTCQQQS